MPIKPVTNTILLPVDTERDVANLLTVLEQIPSEPSRYKREALSRDLGDHFAFLSGANPKLFRPFHEQLVNMSEASLRCFDVCLDSLVPLMRGASDECVDVLVRRLHHNPEDCVLSDLLISIGGQDALTELAEHARRCGKILDCSNSGVWVPQRGPAEWRFSPHRLAMFKALPDAGSVSQSLNSQNPVGLPLDQVLQVPHETAVTWHYVSVDPSEIPGVPRWASTHLHLVSPRVDCDWTMYFRQDELGRYGREKLEVIDDEDDWGSREFIEKLRQKEGDAGRGFVALRPYDDTLVYCNGHIHRTEGVVGTAGGPPIGLYPNPACPTCKKLMFHVFTAICHVRDYGEGWRSLYICETCQFVACNATGWN